jgi:NitT/TauT family transport system substrate-binding protein
MKLPALVAALLLAGMVAPVRSADLVKVTLAQPLVCICGAAIYAAEKLGYYKDEGLDVDIVTISGTAPMFAAVQSESAQFGLTNGPSLLTAAAKGVPLVAFVGTDHGLSNFNMVVSNAWAQAHGMTPNEDYRSALRKLAGAKIGLLGTTSTGGLILAAVAKQLGMPDDALKMVSMPPAAAMAAFANGTIDAWWLPLPPQSGVLSFRSAALPRLGQVVGNVIFSTQGYIARHPEVVVKMARAIARADNAILDPKTQAQALQGVYERITDFPREAVKGEILKPGVPVANGQLSADAFALTNQVDVQIGLLEKALTAEQLAGAYTLKFMPKTTIKP